EPWRTAARGKVGGESVTLACAAVWTIRPRGASRRPRNGLFPYRARRRWQLGRKQGSSLHGGSGMIERFRGKCMLPSLLLSVVLSVGASAPAAAQAQPATGNAALATPQFRRFGTAEGLPSSSVYTVVQAPDGSMWFGTKSGIAHYDGVGFHVFR